MSATRQLLGCSGNARRRRLEAAGLPFKEAPQESLAGARSFREALLRIHALACPECGGSNVRRSRYQSTKERLGALFAKYPFRCRDCRARFRADVLMLKWLVYAKCPRCLRLELTTWSRQNYSSSPWQTLLLRLGAQRCRCSACRFNFVAFRPRLTSSKVRPRRTDESYEDESYEEE